MDEQTFLSKSQLVEIILALDMTIGNLEHQIKELKRRSSEAERRLISLMESQEEKGFTDDSGRSIKRNDRMILTVRNDQKRLWFDWLDSIKRGDLVKTDVNKNSLNALLRKIIRGEEKLPLPEFLDIAKDIFFLPHIDIKIGAKSLRKSASEAIAIQNVEHFSNDYQGDRHE